MIVDTQAWSETILIEVPAINLYYQTSNFMKIRVQFQSDMNFEFVPNDVKNSLNTISNDKFNYKI